MSKRAIALWVVCLVAGLGGGRWSPDVRAEPAAAEYVVVQYGQRQALGAADGPAPSLEARGYRVLAVPAGLSQERFLAQLRADPNVVSAEADARVFAADVPNDPFYANQAEYLDRLGAAAGWDLETGANTVIVAVIDTGIDLAHEDLVGHLWENRGDMTADGVDDDGNGCVDDRYGCRFINLTGDRQAGCGYTKTSAPPLAFGEVQDDHGRPGSTDHSHGTLVAGIIAAAGNNGKGVAGVGWDVKIMTIKVLDCGTPANGGAPSGDMANVAQAIDYARRMGASVINLSLASPPPHTNANIAILRDAIEAAQDQEIVIVCAAGNYGQNPVSPGPGYPGAYTEYPNLITVGAADNERADAWASYSSYGPALDVAAPGNDILGTVRSDLGLATPYGSGRGTSFATPIVSGAIALLRSRDSGLAAAEYIAILRVTATAAPAAPHGGNWAGAGIVNIRGAVERVPMRVEGAALHDWKDVAAGTEVRGVIDGLTCGATTTAGGLVAQFALVVKAASEQPGCGAPGKAVLLMIGALPGQPGFTWGGKNDDLAVRDALVSSVSPPPGPIVTQTIGGGWSLVAHLEKAGTLPGALAYLPNTWSHVYTWDPQAPSIDGNGGYHRYARGAPGYVNDWTNVSVYQAFWVKAAPQTIAMLNPNPSSGRSVGLFRGWNVVVYTGANRSAAEALAPIAGKYTVVLEYDNATGGWGAYVPGAPRYLNNFAGLLKLHIYWIYMTTAGTLAMP